jgi:hypothetical protein
VVVCRQGPRRAARGRRSRRRACRAGVLAHAVGVAPRVSAGPRRRGTIMPLPWKRTAQSRFPRFFKASPVSTSCPSSSPLLGEHRGTRWSTDLPVVVPGGTGNAWANPRPAETPRRLVLEGGFGVDGGRDRRLDERARVLGFGSLRGYLQARCDAGHSVPRIAAELGVRDWQVQAALARPAVRLAPSRQRLAAQRRRYTEERIANRVAALGFAEVGRTWSTGWWSRGGCWRRSRRSWRRIE